MDCVEIYFLPKGHTHGQIDQMFSRLAMFLKRLPAKTLPELCWALYQAFNAPSKPTRVARNPRKTPSKARERIPVKTATIESVVDVNYWLESLHPTTTKVFNGVANTFRLHGSHAFRLCLNDQGDVTLSAKEWAADLVWEVDISYYSTLLILFDRIQRFS